MDWTRVQITRASFQTKTILINGIVVPAPCGGGNDASEGSGERYDDASDSTSVDLGESEDLANAHDEVMISF